MDEDVERILPLEEKPEEEPELVGLPDDREELVGVSDEETVTSQVRGDKLRRVGGVIVRQAPKVIEGVSKVMPETEEDEIEDISDLFEVPKQGIEKEDLSDIFEVGEEDIMGEDEEEEGIEDLFEVGENDAEKLEEEEEAPHWSDEDIKRYERIQKKQQVQKPVYRRTLKRYTPPAQIGGVE